MLPFESDNSTLQSDFEGLHGIYFFCFSEECHVKFPFLNRATTKMSLAISYPV